MWSSFRKRQVSNCLDLISDSRKIKVVDDLKEANIVIVGVGSHLGVREVDERKWLACLGPKKHFRGSIFSSHHHVRYFSVRNDDFYTRLLLLVMDYEAWQVKQKLQSAVPAA